MTLVKTGLALLVGMTVLSAPTYATLAQVDAAVDVNALPTHPVATHNTLRDLETVIAHINPAHGVTLGVAVADLDAAIGGAAPADATSARVSAIQDLLQPSVSLKVGVGNVNHRLGGSSANTYLKVKHLQTAVQDKNVTLTGCVANANTKLGGAGTTVAKIDRIKALSNGSQANLHDDVQDKVTRLSAWIAAKITAGTPIPAFTGPAPAPTLNALIAYLQTH